MERKQFSNSDADKVWIKQFGYASIGKDITGKTIYRNQHSQNGWNVDHIKPISKYGSNNLSNLQVLNAKDNDLKSDKYPCWNDQYGKEHCQEGS